MHNRRHNHYGPVCEDKNAVVKRLHYNKKVEMYVRSPT